MSRETNEASLRKCLVCLCYQLFDSEARILGTMFTHGITRSNSHENLAIMMAIFEDPE